MVGAMPCIAPKSNGGARFDDLALENEGPCMASPLPLNKGDLASSRNRQGPLHCHDSEDMTQALHR